MKKLLFALMLFSFTIISACSDSDEKNNTQPEKDLPSQENQQAPEKQNEKPETNDNNENTVASITQAEALKNIKEQLNTKLPRLTPVRLPHHSWAEGVAEGPAAGKLQEEDLAAGNLPQSQGRLLSGLGCLLGPKVKPQV